MNVVEPIPGEPLRFRVRSRSDPTMTYLVDLEELNFNGQCGCDHFWFQCGKLFRENGCITNELTRCWHIEQARAWFLEAMVRAVANPSR